MLENDNNYCAKVEPIRQGETVVCVFEACGKGIASLQ